MIKILTKTTEMTINRDEVEFIKFLPTCPKCKRIDDVVFFNVTKVIYECVQYSADYPQPRSLTG